MVELGCEETCLRGERVKTVMVLLKSRDSGIRIICMGSILLILFWSKHSLLRSTIGHKEGSMSENLGVEYNRICDTSVAKSHVGVKSLKWGTRGWEYK